MLPNGALPNVVLPNVLPPNVQVGQKENPNYKFLNIFGNVLDHKNVSERYLRVRLTGISLCF